jgi:hypothetical protein
MRPHLVGYAFSPDALYPALSAGSAIVWTMWPVGLAAAWWRQRRRSRDLSAVLEPVR